MSAVMPNTTSSAAPSGAAAIPKAVWAAIGVLCIATAGLATALVMRSTDKPEAPVARQASALPMIAPDDGKPPVAKVQPAQPPAQSGGKAPVHTAKAPAQRAPAPVATHAAAETARAICATCGVVESVQAVQQKGEGSGLGVAGGAVAGGLLGHQVGGGNGKTAMTVLGAVGGAFAGNEIEKRARATTVYDVKVRMEDGSVRTIRRSEPVNAGTKVQIEGTSLRVASAG
ncbi:glycine zipper 2TM domain-containing protein [Ramlibacter sp. MMS24-I3-19]|uniref:glycine zipper 2TM domain-containing protein n=1 Tax=Ramlibacter sp. MMS24-I3-19 TaxID=3416606 RepID=UPI003D063786